MMSLKTTNNLAFWAAVISYSAAVFSAAQASHSRTFWFLFNMFFGALNHFNYYKTSLMLEAEK